MLPAAEDPSSASEPGPPAVPSSDPAEECLPKWPSNSSTAPVGTLTGLQHLDLALDGSQPPVTRLRHAKAVAALVEDDQSKLGQPDAPRAHAFLAYVASLGSEHRDIALALLKNWEWIEAPSPTIARLISLFRDEHFHAIRETLGDTVTDGGDLAVTLRRMDAYFEHDGEDGRITHPNFAGFLKQVLESFDEGEVDATEALNYQRAFGVDVFQRVVVPKLRGKVPVTESLPQGRTEIAKAPNADVAQLVHEYQPPATKPGSMKVLLDRCLQDEAYSPLVPVLLERVEQYGPDNGSLTPESWLGALQDVVNYMMQSPQTPLREEHVRPVFHFAFHLLTQHILDWAPQGDQEDQIRKRQEWREATWKIHKEANEVIKILLSELGRQNAPLEGKEEIAGMLEILSAAVQEGADGLSYRDVARICRWMMEDKRQFLKPEEPGDAAGVKRRRMTAGEALRAEAGIEAKRSR